LTLNPQCLQDGEEKIVAKRIKEILKRGTVKKRLNVDEE
jgi:hypothetical protein